MENLATPTALGAGAIWVLTPNKESPIFMSTTITMYPLPQSAAFSPSSLAASTHVAMSNLATALRIHDVIHSLPAPHALQDASHVPDDIPFMARLGGQGHR